MNKKTRCLTVVFAVLAAAPAQAQPGADQPGPDVIIIQPPAPPPPAPLPAQPAPMTNAWSDVSHINGQLVQVGERGNYLHKWKKTNIASNPVGWLVGFYGLSVSTAIHTNVAIRGDVNYIKPPGSDGEGYEVGASLPIYFKRVYQGPFIEPGVIMRGDGGDDESVGPSVVFGWHWTFDSGLNIAAALGVMRNMNPQMDEFIGDSGVEPSGYFRVGYAF